MTSLKLPKDVAADDRHDAVWKLLTTNTLPLWEGSELLVPTLPLNQALAAECRRAVHIGFAIPGLEAIEEVLAGEQKGLELLFKKAPDVPHNPRASRLLLMSNDGSNRFYRDCEALLVKYDQRLIGCRLDVTGEGFGSAVLGSQKLARALLFVDKKAVARVLLTLVAQASARD
ncbi:MAG TPA: hypothetical protein VIV60_27385 [Polyangiaceae bacterium]